MTTWKPGQWRAICDRCGFKFWSEELKKDWQGLMVCKEDFEVRNSQDFIKIPAELSIPNWVRPRPGDVFIPGPGCTIESREGIAGIGVAGCMIAGFNYPG